MIYTELVNRAIDLAYSAHNGQKDKAGRPYFVHPFTVAMSMETEAEICIALLHDVLEDTPTKLEELEAIFPPEITEAVDVLTHKDGMSYDEYIRRVKENPTARKVKLADLAHNLDITRFAGNPNLPEGYEHRKKKYELAREILLS
ncbi:MAG: HD domain-containing protein [Synergistaceae bacterium]|nr:HD domain-containing protein [Synergistaceae bacterium]